MANGAGTVAGRVLVCAAAALSLLGGTLSGCTTERMAEYNRAIAAETPPRDFTVSVTVLSARATSGARSIITPGRNGLPGGETIIPAAGGQTGASVASAPIIVRPARYVMEADWILRGAVGATSRETFFPDQTRQLDAAQVEKVWKAMQASGVLDEHNPSLVARAPTPEEIDADQRGVPTRYIVSYSVAGTRRTLVMDAPEVKPEIVGGTTPDKVDGTAAVVVKTLGELCWMREAPVTVVTGPDSDIEKGKEAEATK